MTCSSHRAVLLQNTHSLKPLPIAFLVHGRSLWGSRHLASIRLVLFSRHLLQLGHWVCSKDHTTLFLFLPCVVYVHAQNILCGMQYAQNTQMTYYTRCALLNRNAISHTPVYSTFHFQCTVSDIISHDFFYLLNQ